MVNLLSFKRVLFFFIPLTSNFLFYLLAQQACGFNKQHYDEHGKNYGVGKVGRDIGLRKGLDYAEQYAAEHCAGDRADAAENGCGERLDAGH